MCDKLLAYLQSMESFLFDKGLGLLCAVMGPKAESTRLLLANWRDKNSSSLEYILSKSGVVDRDIMIWNLSQDMSAWTNMMAGLSKETQIQ